MSNQANPFSAGDSALGYLYQCRLALWFALVRLRDLDDTDVAIESLDDVTFSTDGKPTELLQTKHHLNTSANLTDASPDLWKTLSDRRRSRRVAIYTWRKDTIGIFVELPLRIEEHDGT